MSRLVPDEAAANVAYAMTQVETTVIRQLICPTGSMQQVICPTAHVVVCDHMSRPVPDEAAALAHCHAVDVQRVEVLQAGTTCNMLCAVLSWHVTCHVACRWVR